MYVLSSQFFKCLIKAGTQLFAPSISPRWSRRSVAIASDPACSTAAFNVIMKLNKPSPSLKIQSPCSISNWAKQRLRELDVVSVDVPQGITFLGGNSPFGTCLQKGSWREENG